VENLTIMFSDLKDSTAMYEDHGDAAAFGRVRSHFDYVFEHVEANRGAIVKTLGDAVMAVFQSPDQALHAALDMQKHVHEFNAILAGQRDQNSRQSEDNAGAHPVVLKIGLHHGPAIAVNSNDRLDYFGRTVNLASRIQGASLGQDIVISGEVWQRPAAQKLLRDYDVRSRHFLANLKGIADILDLYRIEC